MIDRKILVIYFNILAVAAIGLLVPKASVPHGIGYLLLISLYFIPIITAVLADLKKTTHIIFLFLTPIFTMLIVIDPVEIGFFGYDPYSYTIPAHLSFSNSQGISEFMSLTTSWPAFYALTNVIERVIGHSILDVGKYLPLISGVTPTMVYLAVSRKVHTRTAFISAMGFASTRSLLLFEAKFLDETLAIALFFTLTFVLLMAQNRRRSILILLLLGSITLTHHTVSLFALLFISVWYTIGSVTSSNIVPSRFKNIELNEVGLPPVISLFVGMCIFIFILAYFVPDLTRWVTVDLIQSIMKGGGGGGEASGRIGEGSSSIRGAITTSAVGVLGALALIAAYGTLSKRQRPSWVTSWTVFAGIIGLLYSISLVTGRIIPLDPIRFLIVFVPFLVVSALVILCNSEMISRPNRRTTLASILVCALIITQLLAIPPHVLVSDPESTTLSEGHYTSSQFTASDWTSEYYDGQIAVYEPGLWVSKGNSNLTAVDESNQTSLFVWRNESMVKFNQSEDRIYDSGDIRLVTGLD
ncbi:hypothetical protein [Haloferax sp. ATB1]|uniref:hypothetical protein n=1 Tax=Haloferax sp. ATB1 TaxID=1508454 RepID=UPI000AF632A8|nr:hypothetical protein [Haloferax sp. ATB1]